MFQPLQDQGRTFIDNGQALNAHRAVAHSVYHRLFCYAIFTMLLLALAVVETWYLFP
jgi:hypothetical protein